MNRALSTQGYIAGLNMHTFMPQRQKETHVFGHGPGTGRTDRNIEAWGSGQKKSRAPKETNRVLAAGMDPLRLICDSTTYRPTAT